MQQYRMDKNLNDIYMEDTNRITKQFVDTMRQLQIEKQTNEYLKQKQNVNKLISSMSYEKAKRYIEKELNDLKAMKNDKEQRYIIKDSIKFLKQKQRDINKLIKKEEKQQYKLNEVFDENNLLKQKNKELETELKQKHKELEDELKKTS